MTNQMIELTADELEGVSGGITVELTNTNTSNISMSSGGEKPIEEVPSRRR
jgi:hypothetical protein